MNKELLKQMLDEKLVSVQKHPESDLFIYNYSPKVQYEKLWNEITSQTRGLILDGEMNIVSKPFGKFFNIEEHEQADIPNEPFDVFEKMDGSLGILYWINGNPFIATRGSFTSDQSQRANQILYSKYKHLFSRLNPLWTYLFEIIYPENRIVIDYGQTEDLVLLTCINNGSGIEVLPDIGFPTVKKYDGINDIYKLKSLEEKNREGFVIRFKNGFRMKVKFSEYVRLHRIITGVSNIVIWEYLSEKKSFDELLEKVPDEFYNWLTQTKTKIENQYDEILTHSKNAYDKFYDSDKKTFALKILEEAKNVSPILFNMYNGKEYEQIIWKMIRPKFQKPFKAEI